MRLQLDLSQPDRQARLDAFLSVHRISKSHLAALLGIHHSYVGKICSGERRPKEHIQRLIDLGIPADLLPQPGDGRPGPKPRTVSPASASAASAQPATV